MEVTFLTNSLILLAEWRRSESTTEPMLFNFDAPTLSLNVTEEEFIDAIRQRAAKLNLSTELLNALELHHSPRNPDGDVSSDLTSFLASLLGSFLPVFDAASSEGVDKKATTSIASGRPFKIVEVENPDQVSML